MNYSVKSLRLKYVAEDQARSDYICAYHEDLHIVPLVQLIISGVVDAHYEV